jgi:DNA-directed RNA polymerase specialized sigma24 family protein
MRADIEYKKYHDDPNESNMNTLLEEVRRVAIRFCNVEVPNLSNDWEDIAQEVTLRVWQKLGSYDGKSRFSTWLFILMRNVARNYIVQLKPGKNVPLDDIDVAVDHEPFIFQPLNPTDNKIVAMRLDGLTYREIAESLEITKDEVENRLHKIQEKFATKA